MPVWRALIDPVISFRPQGAALGRVCDYD